MNISNPEKESMRRSYFISAAHVNAQNNWFAFFLSLWLLGSLPVFGQTNSNTDGKTPVGLAPGAPAGSYGLSNLEQINLYSGRLSMNLPILSVQGRGKAGLTIAVNPIKTGWRVKHFTTYNPPGYGVGESWVHTYQPEPNWWNDSTLVPFHPGGMLIGRQTGANPFDPNACGVSDPPPSSTMSYGLTHTKIVFSAPDGTEYELRDTLRNGSPLQHTCQFDDGYSRGTTFVTADGSAATFISDTPINDHAPAYNGLGSPENLFGPTGDLILRDGTRYRFQYGRVQWIRDSNGNRTMFGYTPGETAPTEITDSLNRKITFEYNVNEVAPYGLCDRITFRGESGQTRVIRISYNSLANTLRSGQTLKTYGQLFPELDGYGTFNAPSMVSAIWLPDNRCYKFKYNSYSELARVELPTGGAFEYEYSGGENNGTASGVVGEYTLARSPHQYAPRIGIYRRVIERRVYRDSNATLPESITRYGKVGWSAVNVSVDQYDVDQNGNAQNKLAANKHFFLKDPITQIAYGGYTLGFSDWDEGKEFKTEALTATGGLLRRTEQTWQDAPLPAGPRVVETVTTLADVTPNLVAKQTHINPNNTSQIGYDQYNNPTDVWEYDYGSGAPGSLVRRSHTDYVTSSTYTGTSVHLRSLPSAQQVFDAAGNKRAETLYEYDDYSATANHATLVNRTNITGLDAAFTTSYTTRGNVTKVSRWRNTDNTYLTTFSQYDIAGNVVAAIDAGLSNGVRATTTIDYADRFGSPDGEAQSNTPPSNPNWLAGKSTFAFPAKVTNALNQSAYTQFDYFLGKPVDTEDPNGIKASLYYQDALDRPTKGIRAVGTSLANQTVINYDDANKTIMTYTDKDTLNDGTLQSRAVYDGLGRTWRAGSLAVTGQWRLTDTEFDPLGRPKRTTNPYFAAATNLATDSTAVWTTSTYDALSRVTQITTPDGAHVDTAYSGNNVTVTDQAGKVRRSLTDALGRLIRVDEPDSNGNLGSLTAPNQPTSYSYDVLGNLVQVTQGVQNRYFMYDSLGRLLRARNPEQTVNSGLALSDPITSNSSWTIAYAYDPNGNLTLRTDAKAQDTYFEYDALNRPKLKYYSSTNTAQVNYYYDNQTLPSGAPTYSRGSSIGRMVAVTFGGSYPAGASEGDYYGYDQLGRVTTKYQRTGTTNYAMSATYNLAGAMLSETYPSGHLAKWTYNAAGQMDSFKGRLLGEASDKNYATGMSYNAANQLLKEIYGTTTPLYHRMNYNKRLQLFNIRLGTDNSAINDGTDPTAWTNGARNRGELTMYYTSDFSDKSATPSAANNNGNVWRVDHFAPENDAVTLWSKAIDKYHYDSLNRIIDVEEDKEAHNQTPVTTNLAQRYTYDRYGNRLVNNGASNFPVFNLPFSVDVNTNRLSVAIGQTGVMTYDANGALTNDTFTGKGTRIYDSEGRMKQAVGTVLDSNGYPTSIAANEYYTYDGNGKRVKRRWAFLNASTYQERVQVYGIGGELLVEYNGTTVDREYGYRGGQMLVVAIQSGSGLGTYYQYNVTDHLGSTRMSVMETGSLTNLVRRDFLPYGEELTAGVGLRSNAGGYYGGNDPIRQKFTGYERDVEINLDFAQARYMNNSQGRFTSVDPLMTSGRVYNPQSWNRYSYVLNRVINLIDPLGLDAEDPIRLPAPPKPIAPILKPPPVAPLRPSPRNNYIFTNFQPAEVNVPINSDTTGERLFDSPGPDFSSLSQFATIINNGTPQQFIDALQDPLVGTIIFVGHAPGEYPPDAFGFPGPFEAGGLAFGDHGANGLWMAPRQGAVGTLAENVFIFACDSQNIVGRITAGTTVGVDSGSDGLSDARTLSDAAFAAASTFFTMGGGRGAIGPAVNSANVPFMPYPRSVNSPQYKIPQSSLDNGDTVRVITTR